MSRRYGYYECDDCGRTWTSAYTWCYYGTNKPETGQDCSKCNKTVYAYLCEPLLVPKWKCKRCTYENDAKDNKCLICEHKKPKIDITILPRHFLSETSNKNLINASDRK